MKRLAIVCTLMLVLAAPLAAQRRRALQPEVGTLLYLTKACQIEHFRTEEIEFVLAEVARDPDIYPPLVRRAAENVERYRPLVQYIEREQFCEPASMFTWVMSRAEAQKLYETYWYLLYIRTLF